MSALIVTNEADVVRELDADVLVLRSGHAVAYGHGTHDLLWTPSGEADQPTHRVLTCTSTARRFAKLVGLPAAAGTFLGSSIGRAIGC